MACAPTFPAEFVDQPEATEVSKAPSHRRRRCCGSVCKGASKKACTKLATSPTRGMAFIMSIATVLAMTIAMLQLADGQTGKVAAQTLYIAAGFNVLFTLLYTPLIGIFTLSSGFWRAIRTSFCTFFTGLAYTLGLLFVSAVVLVGLSAVFG